MRPNEAPRRRLRRGTLQFRRSGGRYGVRSDRQRNAAYRRCRPADAPAVGDPRSRRADGHQVQLRHRPVRRVHGARRWPARSDPAAFPRATAVGKPVVTIEGVSPDGSHPIQIAWKEFDAPQCGYCQSGMIMSALALLRERPDPSDADIDAQVTNACRCGTYHRVRQAIHLAADLMKERRTADGCEMNVGRRTVASFSRPSPRRRERSCSASGSRRARTRRRRPGAAWYQEPATPEINAWIVIAPDDTVTIRIAQTELGQGVWTSNAMMVCEELQCDWTKVRPQYASANRDAREKAPEWTLKVLGNGATDPKGGGEPTFGNRDRTGVAGIPDSLYRRMRTNAASSVKDGRYYLQLAGAEARERLLLAAAELWNVPVAELTAEEQRHHARVERPHDDLRPDRRSAPRETPHPHPETITIKPPDQWTLMGTEQKNLDVPLKVTGQAVYGIDVRVARHEVGGREGVPGLRRRRQALRLRRDPHDAGRAVRRAVPDSGSGADPRPHLQRRRRRHRRHLVSGQDRARSDADRVEDSARARGVQHGEHARGAAGGARSARQRARQSGRRGRGLRARRQDRRGDLLDAVSAARAHGARQRHGARHRTIAWTSGSAIRARRKRASAPRRSPAFPSRTSTCTCATWAAASAATATDRRPSTRS